MTVFLCSESSIEVISCNVSFACVAKLLVMVAYVHLPTSRLLFQFAMSLSEFGALVKEFVLTSAQAAHDAATALKFAITLSSKAKNCPG